MLQPVSDEEIAFAEGILLPPGRHFDDERIQFIKNLTTCDLQAVPGSGKTTILLAKLLILEKRLPLESGQGVVVISHTNTAVDEIKARLKPYCTKIFTYPNFIGTIQTFVDDYLAIPYYISKHGHRPVRIDNEIYAERISRYRLHPTAAGWVNRRQDPTQFLNDLRFNSNDDLVLGMSGGNIGVGNATPTYQNLLRLKNFLMESGYLHFDDAYYLANKYIIEYPKAVELIRKRFLCVFVDEMQDMEPHQYNILETLFAGGAGENIYQRIGDRNQAIYNGFSTQETNWQDRANVLNLNGSHRLSPRTAAVVQPFGVFANNPILGLYGSQLQPHLLVFDTGRARNVLPRFGDLVAGYIADGTIAADYKYPVKAIGWVGKSSEGGQSLFIPDYYEPYSKDNKAIKIDHHNIISYLVFSDPNSCTLHNVRQNILNAILRILREEGIKANVRDYTKTSFTKDLRESHDALYNQLNMKLYRWSIGIIKGEVNNVHVDIQAFLPGFLLNWKQHERLSPGSVEFLTSADIGVQEGAQELPTNFYRHGDLNIEVTTVHSVKGQTHTATLYMETKFHNYESEKCLNQLLGQSALNIAGQRARAASKLMYVGLSRPTDLLCLAIARERIEAHLPALEGLGWRIVNVN
ncbi:MAG: ATP-dependent helicase [Bacteroidetes bacterium]|nr:ATP-dependent helicase [Bacteroidota bacterium]